MTEPWRTLLDDIAKLNYIIDRQQAQIHSLESVKQALQMENVSLRVEICRLRAERIKARLEGHTTTVIGPEE